MDAILTKLRQEPKIAYFSMEIGLMASMPTYSGGLGILAGDTIKSAADLNLPLVAVTLLPKKGYFTQEIDPAGNQIELPAVWEPSKYMTLLPEKVSVTIAGRPVQIQSWLYMVESVTGGKVPVFFLDSDVEKNSGEDRGITHYLYGGDENYRFKQETVLGIGGVRMLSALGFEVKKYHMNEGHAALLTLELLRHFKRDIEEVWDEDLIWDVDRVKELCVFTTHTPVEAGHDRFSYNTYLSTLGEVIPLRILQKLAGKDHLNMTLLGLNLSNYVNGVAKKHGEVSKNMFPGYEIHSITNGVHSYTWTCKQIKRVFDQHIPGWANEPELFVRADRIPEEEIWSAHMEAKKILFELVDATTGIVLDPNVLTIGFARRATSYKRADLIFSDIGRLKKIGRGKIQLIYAGKAHPRDYEGKQLIKRIISYGQTLREEIKIVFLKDYNMDIALKLVSGVDIWLNNPLRPLEASGTSGMKAAHNGVLNFSVLDGWWIEGHIEGVTGWAIGPDPKSALKLTDTIDKTDADDLYRKLENIIIPLYYNDRGKWITMMKNSIAKVAYYFNTHRMMRRYVTFAYIR
jgi:starch phosphorylase